MDPADQIVVIPVQERLAMRWWQHNEPATIPMIEPQTVITIAGIATSSKVPFYSRTQLIPSSPPIPYIVVTVIGGIEDNR